MSLSKNSTTGTKSGSSNRKLQSLSELKAKISKIFNEEYEDNFNQILILSQEEFFSNVNRRVNLVLSDSHSELLLNDSIRVDSILKELEHEKLIDYKKEFNFLLQQLDLFLMENVSKINYETHVSSKIEKNKKPLLYNAVQKEKENPSTAIDMKDLFEFLAKNDAKRNFYFRKHCIFNKNHALHACFEEQIEKLNEIKSNSNSVFIRNLNLENTNFFLPLFESSYKNYTNKSSLDKAIGVKSSRNTISLTTSYSNFINNIRKSNSVINKEDKFKNLKKYVNKEDEISHNEKNQIDKIKYLICLLCRKVYNGSSVLMHCDFCSLPFYTCLQENKEEIIYPATWEKYHCGAIVNDQMRCLKCKGYLNLNTKTNKLICSRCNSISDPSKVKWNCLVCNEEFKSNSKIYNPLEYKLVKLAIKDAILNKIPTFPEEIDCCMEIREKIIKSGFNSLLEDADQKFYLNHKRECQGLLYEGFLYNRKIVVCSECKTFVNYDKFIWFCPFCNKRYRKRNSNFEANQSHKNEEKDHLRTSFKDFKCEVNFESNTKTDSNRDLTPNTNIDTKNTNNLIQDNSKNEASENTKGKINLEKEHLSLAYRSSNISKVISINGKNNDKAILDRLKSKFTGSNFSSNFDSFISKAVKSKKSPLIKEALNRSINLNFSVNDIEELKKQKNPLNFSMVYNGSSDRKNNKSKNSNKNEKKYFNYPNTNNNSSLNSTFKINNKNNNKLKIISLKGTKFNSYNQSNKLDAQTFISEKENKTNDRDKDQENDFEHSILKDNNKSPFKKETQKSKFIKENDLYEIIKEDNPKFNDSEYEIKIDKDDLFSNYNINETNRDDQIYNKKILNININESPNKNANQKSTITPSAKKAKVYFNSFFDNEDDDKLDKTNNNQHEQEQKKDQIPTLNNLIYNRNSLILKKNSNNKNENYVKNVPSMLDLFVKGKVKRVNNRIYLNSVKFDKNILEKSFSFEQKSEKAENADDKDLNISNNLYIPAKQRIHLKSDQVLINDNCSNEKEEQKELFESTRQLEIMYKTEDKKDVNVNSSLNSGSDLKNSNEINKCDTNLSNKMNIYNSVNSNNYLNYLSTSSISHNNKFINSYLSKKNSENEIFSNLNYGSNKMNCYDNTNYKNSDYVNNTVSDHPSKKNILRHQSLIFTKKHNLSDNKDTLNFSNKAKSNLIQNLEEYFSQNYENNLKTVQEKINVFNDNTQRKTNSIKNLVYRRNKSMYIRQYNCKSIGQNYSNYHNNANNNFIDNINENVESEFSNSSCLVSSSQTISNNNYNPNKDSKNNVNVYAKKNSINSSLNCSSNNTNFNSNLLNNKEGCIINEIIDEDLLELEFSCSKSRLRKNITFNTNSKQDSNLIKQNLNPNNIFELNSPSNHEVNKESKESDNQEKIEIIFCQRENERLSKQININENLRKIKIDNKDEEFNLVCSSNLINEVIESSNKKPTKRTNFKANSEFNLETYPSNHQMFEFANSTYKKDNLEVIECDRSNRNSAKKISNNKVDFEESDILFSKLSPSQLELKYEILNYNSPLSTKKVDFNSNSVKNSIKSSSQISIINTSQNNNYMVDENNINFLIEDFTFNIDDYFIEKSIGEGSYASVFSASNKFTFKKCAIKKIIVDDISQINNMVSEIRILSKFNHENIIQIHGMLFKKLDETTFALYILMELANMDWDSQIKLRQINKVLYTEIELIEILKQITSCLSFLQQNSISHRDIKPNNILIFENSRNNYSKKNARNSTLIKVSDFGEARITQGNYSNKLYTIKGTELFMSPKLIESYQNVEKQVNHNPYKSDCFSLGLCLLYAASLNLNSVFDIRNEIQEKGSISATINKYLKLKFTKKFIDLLIKMLNIDENKRFDFIELNDFLKKY